MIQKNIDIIAVILLLMGAVIYSSAKQAAAHAFMPFQHWHVTRAWEPPRVQIPLPPRSPAVSRLPRL